MTPTVNLFRDFHTLSFPDHSNWAYGKIFLINQVGKLLLRTIHSNYQFKSFTVF